jgi:cytochrome c oxidase cbb3-type subunit 4
MFKFIQQYTEKMDHVAIYPMISLFIFFLFFVVLLVLVKNMDKNQVTKLSNLPLDLDATTTSTH